MNFIKFAPNLKVLIALRLTPAGQLAQQLHSLNYNSQFIVQPKWVVQYAYMAVLDYLFGKA